MMEARKDWWLAAGHWPLDLRFAIRTVRRQPILTVVAALSLSLGVGANAVIFSLVNAILLRPLPVRDPGHLVRIGRTSDGNGFMSVSYPEYVELRDRLTALDGLAAHEPNTVVLNVDDDPRQELMEIVSANYFTVLGINPSRGRGFLPQEDLVPGDAPVIVISDGLWRRRFGADPGVVGRSVKVNGHPFTVVGVAPAGFSGTFAGFDVALWIPVMMHAQAMPTAPDLAERDYRFLMLIGRMAPGITIETVESELAVAGPTLELDRPEGDRLHFRFVAREATGVHPLLGGLIRGFLVLLMTVVGLLLLIACANVANLLLARAVQRRREIAVRMSLGASRRHILSQLFTESVALALLGGLGGVAIAYWATGLLSAFRPPVGMPIGLDVSLDWRVLLFCLVVATGTALVFGLAPAIHGSRVDLTTAIRRRSASMLGRRGGWRSVLVVAQVSVSALLLVGAALLLQSLRNSRMLDPGFDASGMLVIDMDPGILGVTESEGRALWDGLLTRIEALPGVRAATLALMVPLGDRGDAVEVAPDGAAPNQAREVMDYNMVRSGYFDAMGIPLTRGRDFGPADGADAPGAVIINETLERRFWPGETGVGRRINIWDRGGQLHDVTVVGVARDIKYRSLAEGPTPFVYLPLTQWYRHDLRAHVRALGDPAALIPLLRQQVHELNPELPARITTLDEEMAFSLVPIRVAGAVLMTSAGIGIFLVAIGLFGLIAHAVAQRTREFGIRMAIGAGQGIVERMVLLQGFRLTGIGLVIGLALALLATQVLRGLLYGVSPTDPATFVVVIVVFFAVSGLASLLPARRATRVSPAVVLREE